MFACCSCFDTVLQNAKNRTDNLAARYDFGKDSLVAEDASNGDGLVSCLAARQASHQPLLDHPAGPGLSVKIYSVHLAGFAVVETTRYYALARQYNLSPK
jgi:hypothetical protein